MREFKKLRVWHLAREICIMTYRLSNDLPKSENHGLKAQLRRAAVSVVSNIAEGCSCDSEKGFRRFLTISIGSAFEIETQILLINDLNLADGTKINEYLMKLEILQKQLNSLISALKSKTKPPTANG